MRLLVLDVNDEHSSNMERNYFNALAASADVVFYGPGYNTEEVLERGLQDYLSQLGDIDAVFLTTSMFLASGRWGVRTAYSRHRYYLSDYSISSALRYADRIIEYIEGLDVIKLFVFFEDIADLSIEWRMELEKKAKQFYVITIGSSFIEEVSGTNWFGDGVINNNYFEFSRKYEDRIISINPIAIPDNELYFGALENRRYDWAIPGNIDHRYPDRSKINRIIKESEFALYDEYIGRDMQYRWRSDRGKHCDYKNEAIEFVHKYMDSPYICARIPREKIAAWRENYNVSLRKTKVAWADGGTTHTIVRKYAEIPARGAVLFCDKVYGFENYGFKDGVNAIIATVDDVLEKSRELFRDPRRMQEIARAGQELIIKKHTCRIRAQSTLCAIERIQDGKFNGTYWKNGEMKFY